MKKKKRKGRHEEKGVKGEYPPCRVSGRSPDVSCLYTPKNMPSRPRRTGRKARFYARRNGHGM